MSFCTDFKWLITSATLLNSAFAYHINLFQEKGSLVLESKQKLPSGVIKTCPLLAYSRQRCPFYLVFAVSCQNFFLAMQREERLRVVGGDCGGDNLYGDS